MKPPLIPPGLDQHIKNFALGIHGTPGNIDLADFRAKAEASAATLAAAMVTYPSTSASVQTPSFTSIQASRMRGLDQEPGA